MLEGVISWTGDKHAYKGDNNEIVILRQSFEDIELAVQSSTIDGVEDLAKDKGVEDHGLQDVLIMKFVNLDSFVMEAEDCGTRKVEDENDGSLIE